MTFIEKHKLALNLGAKFEVGYWRFPSPEAKQEFLRKSSGMEWSAEQRATADEELEHRLETSRRRAAGRCGDQG